MVLGDKTLYQSDQHLTDPPVSSGKNTQVYVKEVTQDSVPLLLLLYQRRMSCRDHKGARLSLAEYRTSQQVWSRTSRQLCVVKNWESSRFRTRHQGWLVLSKLDLGWRDVDGVGVLVVLVVFVFLFFVLFLL